MENKIVLGILVAAVFLATGTLALTLNGQSLQGNLRRAAPESQRSADVPLNYNDKSPTYITVKPIPIKPLSPEPLPASDNITRAEFAYLIETQVEKNTNITMKNCFVDTVGNNYEGAICAATSSGIMFGYKTSAGQLTGYFGPNDPVTRAEAAQYFLLAANVAIAPDYLPLTTAPSYQYYQDVHDSDWFFVDVIRLAHFKIADILPGMNSNFYPTTLLSKGRAQYMVDNMKKVGYVKQ